ncbi:MAG: hypothetical protein J0I77_05335 [Rudaea sp.]|uniref:hypothetical protein n=1 Tax=unclassified Rudaea TaxID=2627037 RepID=UPI0010F510D4|nr:MULTISPECIES: hypothetical protein [unclassified Rudaea]MBN8885121.1 hypothetical protein [Rudaea sp.]MBR0344800.1 hypothetical protein [Rudaea sp.]
MIGGNDFLAQRSRHLRNVELSSQGMRCKKLRQLQRVLRLGVAQNDRRDVKESHAIHAESTETANSAKIYLSACALRIFFDAGQMPSDQ